MIYTPDGAPAEHAIDMFAQEKKTNFKEFLISKSNVFVCRRAEVGLLSRNIHLRGSDRGDSAQKVKFLKIIMKNSFFFKKK